MEDEPDKAQLEQHDAGGKESKDQRVLVEREERLKARKLKPFLIKEIFEIVRPDPWEADPRLGQPRKEVVESDEETYEGERATVGGRGPGERAPAGDEGIGCRTKGEDRRKPDDVVVVVHLAPQLRNTEHVEASDNGEWRGEPIAEAEGSGERSQDGNDLGNWDRPGFDRESGEPLGERRWKEELSWEPGHPRGRPADAEPGKDTKNDHASDGEIQR
jgi:hypothetical protein